MRTLSTSTAPSYTERSHDRELPPMKLYHSATAPLAFMAPWLISDDKPKMSFPSPCEPHESTCVDSVRRLSILSSLNTANQEGAQLSDEVNPDLQAKGPRTVKPKSVGLFQKIFNRILGRSDGTPKRKHDETEKIEEVKRFAGTPAPKRRRLSSEAPTTAATTRAPEGRDEDEESVEEMQDEQDLLHGETEGSESVEDDRDSVKAPAEESVEETQDEQDLVSSQVEQSEHSGSDESVEHDHESVSQEDSEDHQEEDSVEEMQDGQDEQDMPVSEMEESELLNEGSVADMQDEQGSCDEESHSEGQESDGSVGKMQESQDEQDLPATQRSSEDEQESSHVAEEGNSEESGAESQNVGSDVGMENVEETQESQDEQDSVSQEPEEEEHIRGENHSVVAGIVRGVVVTSEEQASDAESSSSIPSSPRYDFSSDEETSKVIVHDDDISDSERAVLEKHADAIVAAFSDEAMHEPAAQSKTKKMGRRAAELKALQASGTKPGILYFHNVPHEPDSAPHECQFWMNQPLQIQLEAWAKKWYPDLDENLPFTTSVEDPSPSGKDSPPSLLYIDAMKTPNEIASFGLQEPAVIHITFEH